MHHIIHIQWDFIHLSSSFQKLFKEIEDFLSASKNDYRVASLGIHPSVLQFNGFNLRRI